jgi:hypothetical protein
MRQRRRGSGEERARRRNGEEARGRKAAAGPGGLGPPARGEEEPAACRREAAMGDADEALRGCARRGRRDGGGRRAEADGTKEMGAEWSLVRFLRGFWFVPLPGLAAAG